MMSSSQRQLFAVKSQVADAVETTGTGGLLTVKGFASVETIDRGRDLVPAEEFNIQSFMAKPVLMFNHKF